LKEGRHAGKAKCPGLRATACRNLLKLAFLNTAETGLVSRFREICYDIKHGKLLRPLRADSSVVVSDNEITFTLAKSVTVQ